MNLAIKRIILATVFLLPFVIFTKGFYGAVFAKSVFIEGVALLIGTLWIIGKLFKKDVGTISRNIVFMAFGIYISILLISGLQGVLPALSFWSSFDQSTGVIFMLCLFLFMMITSSVFKKIEDWYNLFVIFSLSGILFSLGCLLSELGMSFSKYLSLGTVSGFTIGNSSWTGIYMSFVLFIGLGLAFSSSTKSHKIIGIIALITAFFNPTLTGFIKQYPGMHFGFIGLAQTASYSILFSISIFVLYLIFRKIESIKFRKVFLWSFLSLVIIGILSIFIIGLNPIKNMISAKTGPNRFVYWSIAFDGFKEKPLLGWGGDTYQYIYNKNFNPIIMTEGYAREYWVDKSHNIFFDEIATGGIMGLSGLIFLYGILLFSLLKKAINDRTKIGILCMAIFSGLVSYLIQAQMVFQINIGWFIIGLIVVFVANICHYNDNKSQNNTKVIFNKGKNKYNNQDKSLNIFISILIIVSFCILFNYIIIKPYRINRSLATYPMFSYSERLKFYKEIDESYVGNLVDVGNAFSPYHIRMRNIIKKGLNKDEMLLMAEEIKVINSILANSSIRQHDMDMKLLMIDVGFYSILTGVVNDQDRLQYYDKGMIVVEKMKKLSNQNPIIRLSVGILDVSKKYGLDGVNAFNTEKTR